MKMYCNRLVREEKGKVLIMVLILLVVGGLVLTPLLGLMQTGLIAGQLYERKTAELYAADAGVEEAIWGIQNDNLVWSGNHYELETISLNDKDVDVEIYRKELDGSTPCHPSYMYQIISIATSGDRGATKIEAWLDELKELADFSGLMDNIITINEDLTEHQLDRLMNQVEKVNFDCLDHCSEACCGAVYDYYDPGSCYGCGVVYNYGGWWPPASMLAAHYQAGVPTDDRYPYGTLYVQDYPDGVGPLYREGKLDIVNTGTAGLTLKLNDTIYITGDTTIGTTSGGKGFTVDLNKQTIFVESASQGEGNEALKIGKGVTNILGPGAIVAVGDIYFAPDGDAGSNEEGVFIFSVSGTTRLQPSGEFTGAIAGDLYVKVQPGKEPTLTYPPGGLGDDFAFPSLVEVDRHYDIRSWTIGPKAE